jgi:DNA helicase HerA-like ATPase
MATNSNPSSLESSGRDDLIRETPEGVLSEIDALAETGRARMAALDPELADAVGFTHFDTSSSEDNLITMLLARDDLPRIASQTLLRIKSRDDKRSYLGVVVKGPFSEADAVPPNSSMAIGVVVQGKKVQYTFDYHGRCEVEILGEESNGKLVPPRYRPRPKSPVFLLDQSESQTVLGVGGDLSLGQVIGYDDMEARISSKDKSVLPRHMGVVGTTGGGKSTTVATSIHRFQQAGIATIVFDVEGEYTHVDQPTEHPAMLEALRRRGMNAEGVRDLHIYHLVGRETTNPQHRSRHEFTLHFSSLSPYAIAEILEMSDAQQERFHRAYDVAKLLLRDFGVFPRRGSDAEERESLEVDELTTGYPKMTLQHVLDVVNAYLYTLSDVGKAEQRSNSGSSSSRKGKGSAMEAIGESGSDSDSATSPTVQLFSEFRTNPSIVFQRVHAQKSTHEVSWRALAARLHRLRRLKIFDVSGVSAIDFKRMLQPSRVSVIDLSDTDSPHLNNLVIADILRGLQETQEARYKQASDGSQEVVPALIIIEEAHEFLSAERVAQMPVLFQQVARIAKRGRKRWLGLVFVTQLPQHLPSEVLGLLNNFIIHKISDSAVISRMQKSIGSIDASLWNRVPRLAPGQALVSFASFTRPLMVAIDPAPCKRLLVE